MANQSAQLYDEKALEIANSFIYNKVHVTSTQLRRMYDEVKRLEKMYKQKKENWDEIYPLIKLVKAKITYQVARAIAKASGRDKDATKKVYKNLEKFIKERITNIKEDNPQDFLEFVQMFEAVYGYYYGICVDKGFKM